MDANLDLMRSLAQRTPSRIVLLVMDGVGDLPVPGLGGKTPLEAASTPNLDRLVPSCSLGLLDPVMPGVTPGSGPGHVPLFAYFPVASLVGLGVLEGLGIGFDFSQRDVAARFNFATMNPAGLITDRRAGRINSEESAAICARLQEAIPSVAGAEILVRPVREHRGLVVFRGDGLGARLPDTDPQATGVPALEPRGLDSTSERTAAAAAEFVSRANSVLAGEKKASTLLLRGFSRYEPLPAYGDVFGLRPAAIAVYPMYKGLSRLASMEVVEVAGSTLADEAVALRRAWPTHDYFFVHVKRTDSCGEDGDWKGKTAAIEDVDRTLLPAILSMDPPPDVLAVTGDHSTPCALASHSFHPVPLLVHAKDVRPDNETRYSERTCARGSLGRMRARELMPLLMGYAGKLQKFGA